MKKEYPPESHFDVASYKIDLQTAKAGTDPKLDRMFKINVFPKAEVGIEPLNGVLCFHRKEKDVLEPTLNNGTILLHYSRRDFRAVRSFLETNLAAGRTVTCYHSEDALGKVGGLRT